VAMLAAVLADRQQTRIWRDSGTVFGAMAERNGADFGAQYNLAWFAFKSGDMAAAGAHFERARAIKPDDGRPDYWLGEVALARGRREPARELFRTSPEIQPRQIEPRIRLAELDVADGNLSQARAWLEPIPDTAKDTAPRRASVDLAMADLAARQGACQDVRERCLAALELRPTSSRFTVAAARALHRCGQVEAAQELYRRATEQARDEVLDMVGDTGTFP
jgi:cellulose synthase operon protein C